MIINRNRTHNAVLKPNSMKVYGKLITGAVILSFTVFSCKAQETIPLYPGKVPNARAVPDEEQSNAEHTALSKVSTPALSVYLPPADKATGTAVIICPGGGYSVLVIDREGYAMAKRLTSLGV